MSLRSLTLRNLPTCAFQTIVDDVWIEILWSLPVKDILCLRRTCKQLFSLTTLRCIWLRKFCVEVLAHHLPVPGPYKPLPDISASDLEWRTRRALDLERRWPTSNRVLRNERILSEVGEFDQVVLLPGGRHMLAIQRGNLLTCFSIPRIEGGRPETLGWWRFPYASSCFIKCDDTSADTVAVSSNTTPYSAVVLSMRPGSMFRELRRYEQLSGKVIGLYNEMMLVHAPSANGNDGGIQIFNWKSQETEEGTRVLPSYLDLFDGLVDVAFFSEHILIVWETCVTVIPFPNTSSQDRVRIFRFETPITLPIAFTPCQATVPSAFGYQVDHTIDDNLTIIARSRNDASELVQLMFTPNFSDSMEDLMEEAFAFKLSTVLQCRSGGDIHHICVGSSGRGVWIEGNRVRQFGPTLLCIPPFDLRLTPSLDENAKVSLTVQDDLTCVDFDEGMGRMVVAHGGGGVTVIDLD